MKGLLGTILYLSMPYTTILEQLNPNIVTEEVKTKVIKTKYGKVQGFISRVGRDASTAKFVQVFLGIPYASPPTGNYRFAPTRPPTHWSGVFSATSYGPVCPQTFPHTSNATEALLSMSRRRLEYLRNTKIRLNKQSEDCLNINIYLPHNASNKKRDSAPLPVMLFVHGESYQWGSGNLYDGRVLASYGNVVVVTINYRLGILGFLNTNTAPHQHPQMANYGLMDQIAGLKWIQQNIQHFGGDPESVTMFGYRNGASCIHFLMQSPAAVAGLFHRAILMSGSSFSTWSLVEDPVHYAVKVANSLNCTVPSNMMKNHQDIVKCLREKPLSDLNSIDLKAPSFLTAMGPSRDGVLIPSDFGTSSFHIKKRSTSPSYRIIVGVSDRETEELFSEVQLQEGINPHEQKRLLRTLVRNSYMHHLNEIFYTVENEYSPDSLSGASPMAVRAKVSDALSDKLFVSPALETASWCNESGYDVYLYVHKVLESETEPSGGILPLVFGLPFAPEISSFDFKSSPAKALVSQNVLTYWSNFAHSGIPNIPRSTEDLFKGSNQENEAQSAEIWKPYSKIFGDYFQIDLNPVNKQRYRDHTMSIWLKLVPKLHLSGAEHSFPQHNIFHVKSDLYDPDKIRSQRVQFNRAYESLQLTTGPPHSNCGHTDKGNVYSGMHNATLVKIEEASTAAYNKAILLILLIGFIMLVGNIWFWLCFVIRRRYHSCCIAGHQVGKDISCETELVGSSNPSLQNIKNYSFYQKEYSSDKMSCKSSDGLPRKRSLAHETSYGTINDGQSISFISNGNVPGARANVELVPCLKSSRSRSSTVQSIATLPRNNSRDSRSSHTSHISCDMDYNDHDRTARHHGSLGSNSGLTMERHSSDLLVNLSRSSSQGSSHNAGAQCKAGPSGLCQQSGLTGVSPNPRPRMSTFCHIVPPPLQEPDKFLTDTKGVKQTIQAVSNASFDMQSKFLQPESV